ncbi:VTT domain-containing protein [Modestobacter excelsi]|uniref:VTT domain-containing protein n=1 Tax=Modestobacter excelsi TaxID=2213161 RepID=UPI00110CFF44|nr:VTT domain-containing protein [Modestobacter excelsi]
MTRRYATAVAVVAGISLGGFVLAEALHLPWAATAPSLGTSAAPIAAVLGVGMLVGDAVLPVPSSLVMVALGSTFGLVGGRVLGLVGKVGGALVGFAIGRQLAGSAPPPDGERAARLLRRWGAVAVTVSRPVPVLSETVAVLAGMSTMSWQRAGVAATAGSLPEAALFSWAGASAGGGGGGIVIWLALVLTASAVWAVDHRRASAGRRAALTER